MQRKDPDQPEIEGRSFQTSILYWIGVLEEMANTRFAAAMNAPKSVVGRWRTLSILAEKNGLPISQLAQETSIERTALSRLLDAMEEEQLVQRRPRPDDRRTIEVYILPAGKRAFARMLPVRREVFARAARGMEDDELVRLMKSLRTLVGNLAAEQPGTGAGGAAGKNTGGAQSARATRKAASSDSEV